MDLAAPEQARPTKRRHVSYQVLANLAGDGGGTSPVVTAVAADTPAVDSLESFGIRVMNTAAVEDSSAGVTEDMLAQRAGQTSVSSDPAMLNGRSRLHLRRQPRGPPPQAPRRSQRQQSLAVNGRISVHSIPIDQLHHLRRGSERKCAGSASKRKRAESAAVSLISGRPAVPQRVIPVRACRGLVSLIEPIKWVPRKVTPSGAESGVPFDPG